MRRQAPRLQGAALLSEYAAQLPPPAVAAIGGVIRATPDVRAIGRELAKPQAQIAAERHAVEAREEEEFNEAFAAIMGRKASGAAG
jgi:hypothetical protein